jgi:hypothetical protein
VRKLPVFGVIGEAYAFVWQKRRRFLTLAAPGVFIHAALPPLASWILTGSLFPDAVLEFPGDLSSVGGRGGWLNEKAVYAGELIVLWAIFMMFCVAWHREYLVPDERESLKSSLILRSRHGKYFRIWLEFMILSMVLAAGIFYPAIVVFPSVATLGVNSNFTGDVAVSIYIIGTCWLVGGWFYARISMAFPAAAIDRIALSHGAWQFSRGNGWRLFSVISIAAFAFLALAMIIELIAGKWTPGSYFQELLLVYTLYFFDIFIYFVGVAVGVSVLSIAYERLGGSDMVET